MNQRYTHRDRKMLDLAHELHDCTIQVPGVCRGYVPEGLEPVHSNLLRHGRGASFKSHDLFHAAGCHSCHMAIDHTGALKRADKEHYWQMGFERTMLEYFKRGWLGVVR